MTLVAFVLICFALVLIAAVFRHGRSRPARQPVSRGPVRPRRRIRTEVPHVRYHYCYADSPETIYHGISNDPQGRADEHENDPKDQWWMCRSDRLMRIDAWYPNRTTAHADEVLAIVAAHRAGDRIANYQHNPGRRRARLVR